ncbi:hypothetical protein BC936DRAFT_143153 [Jimgerdemannia flammicorona]|uniref:DUF8032 domain-containing protein n=1 Tax=Jimgerdemannia flammicorona TaxID=994334 RepID=A0A433DEC3_9FUNG|nr:hypothetical protein BC936DRAFT_143153 [Jimgerdemannia flammicorona]
MDIANVADSVLLKTEPLDTDIKPSDILNQLQLPSTPCATQSATTPQSVSLSAATLLQSTQAMNGSADPMLTIPFSASAIAALTATDNSNGNALPHLSFTDVNVTLTLQELLDPTSNAEDVLAVLTPEQLTVIEKTLNKVKRKKLNSLKKTREGAVIKAKMHHQPQHIVPKPPTPTRTPPSAVCLSARTMKKPTPSPPLQASFPPTPPATNLPELHGPLHVHPLNNGFSKTSVALVTPPADCGISPMLRLPATSSNFGSSRAPAVMISASSTADSLLPLPIKQEPMISPASLELTTSVRAVATSTPASAQDQQTHSIAAAAALSCHEPVTEVKDGVEWVSFIYSHNRTLKQYSVRTDIDSVQLQDIDEKFKNDNCVYPRANLSRETYQGNRWAYETECNLLGWKLAWLNQNEISGKRGLIQRAVDSYRNRYPNMRSRRVARQEKLMNGTLRKRKNRENGSTSGGSSGGDDDHVNPAESGKGSGTGRCIKAQKTHHHHNRSQPHATDKHPKTFVIDDFGKNTRCRIRINVDDVNLSEIDLVFKKNNSVYPRAAFVEPETYTGCQSRWEEECECNDLGWKLAWLNPRHLANKKALLQRALDIYRSKFLPNLRPRRTSKHSFPPQTLLPNPPQLPPSVIIPHHEFISPHMSPSSSFRSCSSSTTDSLDFGEALSPPDLGSPVDADTLLADTGSPDFEELLMMQDDEDDEETSSLSSNGGSASPASIGVGSPMEEFHRTLAMGANSLMSNGDFTMGMDAVDMDEQASREHHRIHRDSGYSEIEDPVVVKMENGEGMCDELGIGMEDDEFSTEQLLNHLLK